MTLAEAEMALPGNWVRRCLALLGVEHELPSLPALTALTTAHARAIVFANVTSLLRCRAHPDGDAPPLDPQALLANCERGRGGGVCFELAGMFGWLLRALGY